jgi:hypothetical protein
MLPGVEYVTGCSEVGVPIACIARMARVCRHGPLCQVGMCGCVSACVSALLLALSNWSCTVMAVVDLPVCNPNSKQA